MCEYRLGSIKSANKIGATVRRANISSAEISLFFVLKCGKVRKRFCHLWNLWDWQMALPAEKRLVEIRETWSFLQFFESNPRNQNLVLSIKAPSSNGIKSVDVKQWSWKRKEVFSFLFFSFPLRHDWEKLYDSPFVWNSFWRFVSWDFGIFGICAFSLSRFWAFSNKETLVLMCCAGISSNFFHWLFGRSQYPHP